MRTFLFSLPFILILAEGSHSGHMARFLDRVNISLHAPKPASAFALNITLTVAWQPAEQQTLLRCMLKIYNRDSPEQWDGVSTLVLAFPKMLNEAAIFYKKGEK